MAILVNIGQRGFVLKEGFVGPTQQVTVDQETAEKLSKMYPQELKIVVADKIEKKVEEPKPVVKEEPVKEEPVQEQPKKGRGKKKKDVK